MHVTDHQFNSKSVQTIFKNKTKQCFDGLRFYRIWLGSFKWSYDFQICLISKYQKVTKTSDDVVSVGFTVLRITIFALISGSLWMNNILMTFALFINVIKKSLSKISFLYFLEKGEKKSEGFWTHKIIQSSQKRVQNLHKCSGKR